jgi:hypothetical protein
MEILDLNSMFLTFQIAVFRDKRDFVQVPRVASHRYPVDLPEIESMESSVFLGHPSKN